MPSIVPWLEPKSLWWRLFESSLFSVLAVMIVAESAWAYDVRSMEARRENLLEYIAGRDDLEGRDRRVWDRAIRLTFGGSSLKDGRDEGVTVAKSVISAAIFFGASPKNGAKAAYEAYHDTYRWVPPPLAIQYQVLHLQGRRPAVTARELAYRFPRYFNEELAPVVVVWWDRMLSSNALSSYERPRIEDLLQETRLLMVPMLLDKLWSAAQLEALNTPEAQEELAKLAQELRTEFKGVAPFEVIEGAGGFLGRYGALAKMMGLATTRPQNTARSDHLEAPHQDSEDVATDSEPLAPEVNTGPPPPVKTKDKDGSKTKQPGSGAEDLGVDTHMEATTAQSQSEIQIPVLADTPKKKTKVLPQPKIIVPTSNEEPEKLRPVVQEALQSPAKVESLAGFKVYQKPKIDKGARRRLRPPLAGQSLLVPYSGWHVELESSIEGWLGVPYLWGGVSRQGVDCSAFTRSVFRSAFNMEIPRNSRAQHRVGQKVSRKNLKPGDLVFFDPLERGRISHVGVYFDKRRFAHASSSRGVTWAKFDKPYYKRAYRGAKRLVKP
jgi:hypothetical protein